MCVPNKMMKNIDDTPYMRNIEKFWFTMHRTARVKMRSILRGKVNNLKDHEIMMSRIHQIEQILNLAKPTAVITRVSSKETLVSYLERIEKI